MKTTYINMIGVKDCPYTWRGENLALLRRAKLYKIAGALDLKDPSASKNELLTAMLAKLKLMSAETELSDMIDEL